MESFAAVACFFSPPKSAATQSCSSSPLLRCLSIASCHILTAATPPTPPPPRKYAARILTRLMKMDGWLGANGTGHLTVDCLSPSALGSRAQSGPRPHPPSTPLLMEMKTSRLMGSIMAVDRWKTSRFSPALPPFLNGKERRRCSVTRPRRINRMDGQQRRNIGTCVGVNNAPSECVCLCPGVSVCGGEIIAGSPDCRLPRSIRSIRARRDTSPPPPPLAGGSCHSGQK